MRKGAKSTPKKKKPSAKSQRKARIAGHVRGGGQGDNNGK